MRLVLVAASAAAIVATTAFAGPIDDRMALMKSNGQAVGSVAPIAKGEKEFDAEAVKAAFEKLSENAEAMDIEALWPEGSETGMAEDGDETTSAPAIWDDREAFVAAVEKFRTDTAAAVEANPQDVEAFREQFGKVTSNCGGCHEDFRVKKG